MTAVLPPRTGDETVHIGLVEADLLAAHAGASWPFPLRVPSYGRIDGEREILFATAAHALRVRGLADESGPDGLAAEAVTALRERRGIVDLVVADAEGATAVTALVYQSSALICRQRLEADTLSVRRVDETALVDAVLAEIPKAEAARTMPVTLPAHAVKEAMALDDDEDDTSRAHRLRDLVRDSGGDPAALDSLVGLVVPLTGRGQLGATRDGRTREGRELSWMDGPRGRVRINPARDGWISVNSLRPADLRFALGELATVARRPR
ncbi:ESX secretion-associated protein EspG [Amycolatopsis echigonensis]|uniref:ESX secretion-associated protein EspG n=1 Tax=Amycolatopsis echigonensis TaxID=2576905 RepID=A0A8E1W7U0_9PSEU|nr:ESX secretion-associated protein EspG [Amycolatopsis echigonensis]MBB2505706.1 ESX secretion-associated protein EspG [Amycolatopsis echigonensis]